MRDLIDVPWVPLDFAFSAVTLMEEQFALIMEADPKDVVDFVLAAKLKSFELLLISKTRCKGGPDVQNLAYSKKL